jgi:hypothetical protein
MQPAKSKVFAFHLQKRLPVGLTDVVMAFAGIGRRLRLCLHAAIPDPERRLAREEVQAGHMDTDPLPCTVMAAHDVCSRPFYQHEKAFLKELFSVMRVIIAAEEKTCLTIYARFPHTADLPDHYDGHGLTVRMTCILYSAEDDDDTLRVEFGRRDKWYWNMAPSVYNTFSVLGEFVSADERSDRDPSQPAVMQNLYRQLCKVGELRGRAELVDAWASNAYDWANFSISLQWR